MNKPAADLVKIYLDALKLSPLLEDPGVEDLAIQEPGVVWLRQHGGWRRHDIPECDLLTVEEFAVVSGSTRHIEHGEHRPILDTDLDGGLRLNVTAFPHVPLGTISITIRKHEDDVAPIELIPARYETDGWNRYVRREGRGRADLTDLYHRDPSPEGLVEFLKACVRARQNIMLVGATGSSKTSLLKTLCAEMPRTSRVITVEDAREATILHPNHARLQFKRDDLSHNAVTAEILLQAAMRMRPDIVILGEVRGREAWAYVNDVIPPHPGSICTIHGNTPASGFMRLIALCKAAPAAASYDDHTLAILVAQAVDVIVPLEHPGSLFRFHPIWFVGEAEERGSNALELLEM